MNQKEMKALKKQIVEEFALNVGYNMNVIPAILKEEPEMLYFLLEKKPEVAEWLAEAAKGQESGEFNNILVSELIQSIDYQTFKKIAPYFFSYEMTEAEVLAAPIEITRAMYNRFQEDSKKLFDYEHPKPELQAAIKTMTHDVVKNENQVLGVDSTSQTIAILEGRSDVEPFFEDALISDYRRSESDQYVLAERLFKVSEEVSTAMIEILYDSQEMLTDPWEERTEPFINFVMENIENVEEKYPDLIEKVTSAPTLEAMIEALQETEEFQASTRKELALELYDSALIWEGEGELLDDFEYLLNAGPGYSSNFNEEVIKQLNVILEKEDKELVMHTVHGYSQGDVWELSYLIDREDTPELTKEAVKYYLEHEIGAYYRGSLTELTVYDVHEEVIESYIVDREEFWHDELSQLKQLTGNENYVDVETALALEKEKQAPEAEESRGISR